MRKANRDEKGQKQGRSWRSERRRLMVPILGIVLLILCVGVGVTYNEIRPFSHFRHLPVVTVPSNPNQSLNVGDTHRVTIDSSRTSSAYLNATSSSFAETSQALTMQGNGTFNVLLLGIDARVPNEPARTDTILVIHVDLVHHRYDVLSIPRDLRVYLPNYGYTKITHSNYMGELSGGITQGTHDIIQAVSNLTGITINYYAETNYRGLQGIVDTLGGINMDVPFPVYMDATWYDQDRGKTIPAGTQFLNGEVVTDLVHQRDYVPGGDFGRQLLQKQALLGIAHRVLSPSGIRHLPQFIDSLSSFLVTTNATKSDILSMAIEMNGFKASEVHYFQVPGHPWSGKDPIVGTVLDYWIADTSKLHSILKANFE